MPRTILTAIRDAAESIAGLRNVLYVTVGEKHTGGAPAGSLALIAYVNRKEKVDGPDRIPESVQVRFANGRIRDVPTDVIELHSAPTALGVRAGNVIRAGDGDQGMCGLTFDHQGAVYVATNAHVVSNVATQVLPGEPGVIDPATQLVRPLGSTIYCSQFFSGAAVDEDLAVIRVTQVPVDSHYIVGEAAPIAAFGNFGSMPGAQFWYNVNGVRIYLGSPQPVLNKQVQILVDGTVFLYTGFWAVRVTQGLVAPGHSGSLVCSGNGGQIAACGMLFGGAPPNWAYVFSINDVWSRILAHLP